VAIGPLVGGAVIELADWHWIFWINVPIGLLMAPIAYRKLEESYGPKVPLDLPGLAFASTGLFGLVYGLVRAQTIGWTAPEVMLSIAAGIVLLALFVRQELRTESPMLPMQFFAKRSFAVTNVVSMAMYFGMFGSIFFLSQFMQNVLGNSPLQAGLKLLVWTGATMVVAPLAGVFSEKFGPRWFMVAGVSLQAVALGWLATEVSTTQSYGSMIIPFILAGSGMALVFAPSASAILNSVRVDQAGQASGAANAIRELGGTFGIAVLATVFSGAGAYTTPQAFVDGLVPALWVGVAVLAFGAIVAAVLPFGAKATEGEIEEYAEEREEAGRGERPGTAIPAAS
jgi:EmrB/QacA subfamily drug resistance transporter